MKTIVSKAAALLLATTLSSLPHHHVQAVQVGDQVCITGYIMDNYCLFETAGLFGTEEGRLLDNSDVITLQNPEEHSFHCLLDVPQCYESGFQVLGDKDPATDRHCLGFRLDNANAVLEAGRALGKNGYCSTCMSEDGAPEFGYRATVRGTVQELGDGSESATGPPLLTNIELLDESVGCENPTTPPLCTRSSPSLFDEPEPTPSPTKEPTDEPTTATPTETTQSPVGPSLNCPGTLDKSTVIDDKSTFYYAMVPSDPPGSGNGILCGRVEAENDGWVGLAISRNGVMIGSEAIIGNPSDGTVLKYALNGKASDSVTPMSAQTLRDTLVFQQDGMTVMTFTKLLEEEGEIPIVEGQNIFLHARGGSSLGYHSSGRLTFNVDISASSPATTTTSPVILSSASPVMAPVTLSPSMSPATVETDSPTPRPSTTSPTESPMQMTNAPTDNSTSLSTEDMTTDAPRPSCPETLEQMYEIDDVKTLYYAVVPSIPADANNGILCARLEAAAEAWLGFGISTDGQMIGSEAIMGNPDSPPLKCNLVAKSNPACLPMDGAKQTLMDVSFVQEEGMSKMSFTKLLVEDGEIPINATGKNTFLSAHGVSNEWGYHSVGRGSFMLNFGAVETPMPTTAAPSGNPTEPPMQITSTPTVSPTAGSTEAMTTAAPTLSCPETLEQMYEIDEAKTFYYAVVPSDPVDANNGILCARMEAAAEAWLGFGISTDGMMIGSEAIIGNPAFGVRKYNLNSKTADPPLPALDPMEEARQTLMNVTFVQEDGVSKMSFTKLLVEDGEIPINATGENIFLHTHGSSNDFGYHAGRGPFTLDLGAAEPTTTVATTVATTTAGETTATTTAEVVTPTYSPTMPPAPKPTTSPEGMPTVSPSMMPVIVAPTMAPVSKERITEPPFPSGSAGTVGAGLAYLIFAGATLAMYEILL